MNAMDKDIMLSLSGVGKKFCRSLKRGLVYGTLDVTRTLLGMRYDTTIIRKDEFWALKDISLELRKGTAIGVIGGNGAGKSTLLRLISGILSPDCGRLAVRGRVGTLIALGAGFHPYLSGRENILLNGAIMGMTKAEIGRRFDEIIAFADIGPFIDAPISTYSSGMRVRLGFSIAIHSSPDILVIDEVLSVGDANFMKKSFERMESMIRDEGVTAIVVSHNMGTIQRLCSQTLVLDKGTSAFFGDTRAAVSRYYESVLGGTVACETEPSDKLIHHRECGMEIHADDFIVLDENGRQVDHLYAGQPAAFVINVRNTLPHPVQMPMVSVLVLNPQMTDLYTMLQLPLSSATDHGMVEDSVRLVCRMSYLGLAPGRYKIIIKIGNQEEGVYDSAIVSRELKVDWASDLMERSFSAYSGFKCVMPVEWAFLDRSETTPA